MHVFLVVTREMVDSCMPSLGDIPQNQRLYVLVALLQKFPLTLDDAGGHLEQGLVAILQALEKPARLLQMVFR